MTIYFDMDGTIADLYSVDNWLAKLRDFIPTPYLEAKPMMRFSLLARYLNLLQVKGYRIGIISWLSKNSNSFYDEKVTEAKRAWLKKHLPSVHFDEIHIVPYGTPKSQVVSEIGILFDDEESNRNEWRKAGGIALNNNNILERIHFWLA